MQHGDVRMNVKCALETGCQLGEGLHWDAAANRLWLVDIHGRRIIRWELGSQKWHEWKVSERVGWVLSTQAVDEKLVGFQSGMARLRLPADGSDHTLVSWVAKPFPPGSPMRLNDAKTDARGRVWAGSLNNEDESLPDGQLFRLDERGHCEAVDSPYRVANGPAISPCQSWMLHTDSAARTIYAFDLDIENGTLSNKRVWMRFSEADGYPDGMTFDAQGGVWVAHWGGACVSRFASDGQRTHRVALPTAHVTNVCFAGVALDRLFVTTARQGLSPTQLMEQPLAGHLFEIDAAGFTGLTSTIARTPQPD